MTLTALEMAQALAPEIALSVLGLFVLLLDVAALRDAPVARRSAVVTAVTVLGVAGVIGLLCQHLSVTFDAYAIDRDRVVSIDRLSIALRIAICGAVAFVALLSTRYGLAERGMRGAGDPSEVGFTRHVGEYFCVLLFAAVGMNLLVSTQNLVMIFVALELLSICLYILTAFHKGVLRSAEGALKYFMIGALSSAFLVFGMSWVMAAGRSSLPRLSEAVAKIAETSAARGGTSSLLLVTGLVFMLVGLGFKIAAAPFHAWAPDAYEGAPTPVTAFIATGSKIASFVVVTKLLLVGFGPLAGSLSWAWQDMMQLHVGEVHAEAGWVVVVAPVAALSMLWGNFAAIAQKNTKRLLAYSSVAHGGYILTALLAGTKVGVVAALAYLVMYSVTTLGVFGVVAAVTRSLGGDDLEDLDGLVHRSPLMASLLLVFVLSLAGIPPLAGFVGKFYLFGAAVAGERDLGLLWLVVIALFSSAVSLYYYLGVLKRAFVSPPRRTDRIALSPVWTLPLVALALGVVVLGCWPQPLFGMFEAMTGIAGLGR